MIKPNNIIEETFIPTDSDRYERYMARKHDLTEFLDGEEVNEDILAIVLTQTVINKVYNYKDIPTNTNIPTNTKIINQKILTLISSKAQALNKLCVVDVPKILTKASLMLMSAEDIVTNPSKRELVDKYIHLDKTKYRKEFKQIEKIIDEI